MAFEMLTGEVPFRGPALEDFREQHLGMSPPPAPEIMTAVATLIEECLFKAPSARPSAANVRARLERVAVDAPSPGLARLQQANQAAVRQEGESSRLDSEAQTEKERRDALYAAGERALERIAAELQAALLQAAPAIRQDATTPPWQRDMEFTLRLGAAELKLVRPRRHARGDWDGRPAPAFDVVGYSSLSLLTAPNQFGYAGRSHSLWFADALKPNEFLWYETGFMFLPLMAGRDDRQIPFSLSPGEDAAFALAAGLARIQVAWPFTPVVSGALDEFIERWATWLADASEGHLSRPSPMPERPTEGSWRK
jgi:serine/threonine-protein kinase